MSENLHLKLLRYAGDPFERIICESSEALLQVLQPYAQVWAEHIEPRRVGDGSQISDDWMPFGGSHYTALIRLYHAYRAKETTRYLCKKVEDTKGKQLTSDDYAALLEIHSVCAGFWENLGSSIDNFAHAWDDARRILVGNAKKPGKNGDEPISGKTISNATYKNLNRAFARRTQYIHSRLVPKRLEDGMVIFNLRHYDDERTIWLPGSEQIETIDTEIENTWGDVLNELSSAWARLFSWLQSMDKYRPEFKSSESRLSKARTPLSASRETLLASVQEMKPASNINVPPSGTQSIG